MARAERTEIFDVPADKFYQAIVDYKNYPQFVDGMKSVEVKSESADGATVTFNLNLIKEISYTIKLANKPHSEVSWSLVSGDMMKINNGKWTLKDLGGKTEVTYSLEVELKGFMPGLGMIEKTLVNTNLPLNMKAFAKRAASL
ncbi:type II toxin-antitoxin system RatA family toxin [Peredibacter starrii]|uniref:SRPBCC family protein n=1 Tax=Peredibacter starrii TaxID=28202 RepID=A0AAX4HL72_9BACT|nr:SRPBCC family protein [Peredibacter starrii]WPU63908.1 SRPBCC family protein [Peredibacter starrii]